MNRMRARLGVLIFALLVGTGVANAQPFSGQAAPRAKAEHSFVTQVWGWLSSMLGKADALLDPSSPPPPSSGILTDGGSSMDPSGGGK